MARHNWAASFGVDEVDIFQNVRRRPLRVQSKAQIKIFAMIFAMGEEVSIGKSANAPKEIAMKSEQRTGGRHWPTEGAGRRASPQRDPRQDSLAAAGMDRIEHSNLESIVHDP